MKNCDIFLSFAQNIDCWYTLKPPHYGASKGTHDPYLEQK